MLLLNINIFQNKNYEEFFGLPYFRIVLKLFYKAANLYLSPHKIIYNHIYNLTFLTKYFFIFEIPYYLL